MVTLETRKTNDEDQKTIASSNVASVASLIGGSLVGMTCAFLLATGYLQDQPMPDSVATMLWYGVRAAGVAAYLVLWLSIVAGLLLSGRVTPRWFPGGVTLPIHELTGLALSLAMLHVVLLLGDRYAGFTPDALVIPFHTSYRPVWTTFGIVALYLMAIVYWSINLRSRIGYRAWRLIHYLGFVAFALATVHGFATGTDSTTTAMRLTFAFTGTTITLLTLWRWQRSRASEARKRAVKPATSRKEVPARVGASATASRMSDRRDAVSANSPYRRTGGTFTGKLER